MFNRANKVTALLVAAASVMTMVPAMASTRLGTRDGHITGHAIAYDNGKYAYEGYRTEADDNGIYYNNGTDTKEKFNDDLRDYTLGDTAKYGTKYAYAVDNNDQYLVDLTTGKIVDGDTPEDKAEAVKSKLRSALKKTDRYENTGAWDTVTLGETLESRDNKVQTRVLPSQFGEVWYKYSANGDKDATEVKTEVKGVARQAGSFTYKLPTTLPATGELVYAGKTVTGTTLKELKVNIAKELVADTALAAIFDVTTIKPDTMTGSEQTIVLTAKDSAVLKYTTDVQNLANKYDAATLGAVITTTGAGAQKTVDATTTTTTTGGAVAPVDTTTGAAVAAIQTGNATIAAYQNLGLKTADGKDLVVDQEYVAAPQLTLKEANAAITAAIAKKSKGDAASDAAANLKFVTDTLKAASDAKFVASKKVELYIGTEKSAGSVAVDGQYVGFVNESGKYIDVSHTANIYIYDTTAKKTVRVKEYNKKNADYNITVGLKSIDVIAQDKDYLYTLTKVGVAQNDSAVVDQYFIQKISKAQGTTEGGAYLPKTVDSYQIDNKSIFDDGDTKVAYNFLVSGSEDGFDYRHTSAKDGTLYITGTKTDKVKVFKIALKKAKIDTVSINGSKVVEDVDVYIAKKDGNKDIDLRDNTAKTAVTWDVEGNTWVVSKGKITKFTGIDAKEMFTCDTKFDNIDVYNDNNLIAWDKDDDFYTNVAEGTKVTQSESTAVAPVIVTGWVAGTDGTWTFNDATGAKVVNQWQNLKGAWYFLKADGIMATGWYQDGANWYYLDKSSGAMQTGWLNDNGTWYYLNGSGAMLSNTTVDGYELGNSGAWIQ